MRVSLQEDVRQHTRAMENALLTAVESNADVRDKPAMSEPSRLVWRDWTAKERRLWFGYWALLLLATWGLVALLRCAPSSG